MPQIKKRPVSSEAGFEVEGKVYDSKHWKVVVELCRGISNCFPAMMLWEPDQKPLDSTARRQCVWETKSR